MLISFTEKAGNCILKNMNINKKKTSIFIFFIIEDKC